MGTLNFDRYHAAMGDASYKEVTRVHDKPLSETPASIVRNASFLSPRFSATSV